MPALGDEGDVRNVSKKLFIDCPKQTYISIKKRHVRLGRPMKLLAKIE